MNIRPLSNRAWLAAVLVPLGASLAWAQAPAPPATAGTAAVPEPAAPAAFRSALEGYQPYADEKTVSWKEANDRVGSIGGWRVYAKEAQEPGAPGAAAKPDPHAGHAKP